jgi:hypothetical protein
MQSVCKCVRMDARLNVRTYFIHKRYPFIYSRSVCDESEYTSSENGALQASPEMQNDDYL